MTTVAVQIKVMPESLETNLEELDANVKTALEEKGAQINKSEQQDIAFGLKALLLTFAWQEEKDTSIIEELVAAIPGVKSIQITDYRRAFG